MTENDIWLAKVTRDIAAPAEAVWDVLADGWLYATWVVGAARIREVEDAWPQTGSRIHHSIGVWPLMLSDDTSVESSTAPTESSSAPAGSGTPAAESSSAPAGSRTGPAELVLQARGWPLGEARVRLRITPNGPTACTVTMEEDADRGPWRLIPKPVRQLMIAPRNTESLTRLAMLAEGRRR
jgi:hypothetical protein